MRAKLTVQEALEKIDENPSPTQWWMTRLQNQMSKRNASRLRRILQRRARTAQNIANVSKAYVANSKKPDSFSDSSQKYYHKDAAPAIPAGTDHVVLVQVRRYPDASLRYDVRLWRRDGDKMYPTRNGIALDTDQCAKVIEALSQLIKKWRRYD